MQWDQDHINYNQLFQEYKQHVYQSAYTILRNEEDAQDIVQETFITVLEKLHTLRNLKKFRAWICRIAVNLAINRYRKKRKEMFVEDESNMIYLTKDPIDVNTIEETVEANERNRVLKEKIEHLKDEYREIIDLYYYEDLSYKEIGQFLDINIGAVKSRLHRAKMQLRKVI
ncbi:RNA polymerase sigma factor [Clostridiaceae bacterium 35-E11]